MNIREQSERDRWKLLRKIADAVRIGHDRPSIERKDSFMESTVQSKASPEFSRVHQMHPLGAPAAFL